MRIFCKPVDRRINGFRVCSFPGEVLHSLVGTFTPRRQLINRDLCWSSEVCFKAEIPGTFNRRDRSLSIFWEAAGSAVGMFTEHDENRSPRLQVQRHRRMIIANLKRSRLDCPCVGVPQFSFLAGYPKRGVQGFVAIITVVYIIKIPVGKLTVDKQEICIAFWFVVIKVWSNADRTQNVA